MERIREFVLDLDPGVDLPVIHVKHRDQSEEDIEITLACGAGCWLPEQNVIFTLRCRRPNLTTVTFNSEMTDEDSGEALITVNGNVLTVKLIEDLYSVVGKNYCDILLTKNDELISTGKFIIDVFESSDTTDT